MLCWRMVIRDWESKEVILLRFLWAVSLNALMHAWIRSKLPWFH